MKKENQIRKADSLRYNLPLKIIAILIVVFLSIFGITTNVLKQYIIKSNIDSMEQIVELSKNTVETWLNSTLSELKVMVNMPEVSLIKIFI